MKKSLILRVSLLFTLLGVFGHVSGAVISGTFTSDPGTPAYDLTDLGELDWAYWNKTSDPATGTHTNSKSGGSLIGNMVASGGTDLRGSTSGNRPVTDFTYSDGTSPASGSVSNVQALFNQSLATVGAGVAVDINLPDAGTVYDVRVWVAGYTLGTGFEFEGEMTASLLSAGATAYTDSSLQSDVSSPKDSGFYSFLVSSDVDNDTFTLDYSLASRSGSSASLAHTLMSGVAVSVVPEPSTFLLMAGFGLLMLAGFIRRR